MEEALRQFVGIDLGRKPVPDETTVFKLRHLLEKHDLGRKIFEQVHEHLEARGIKVNAGTVVDAAIISAPNSTRNATKSRDPEMHQIKKATSGISG